MITCSHGESILIADGYITLYLDDGERNRDWRSCYMRMAIAS